MEGCRSGADQTFTGIGQNRVDLVPVDSGKPGKEVVHARAFIQILKQGAHRHTRPFKHPGAADAFGRSLHHRALIPVEHGED
jgi:hypothetical protein